MYLCVYCCGWAQYTLHCATASQETVSVQATTILCCTEWMCEFGFLYPLAYVCVCKYKTWLYRLYHSYRPSSVTSTHTVRMIDLHSVALYSPSVRSVCGVYRNISLGFVLTQVHEAAFQEDPARRALRSHGELEGGRHRAGHASDLHQRRPAAADACVKRLPAALVVAVSTK